MDKHCCHGGKRSAHQSKTSKSNIFLLSLFFLLQARDLEWFPRMRAMSLAIDETEGEQNEMRNLNEKLESTTKLIHTLSHQLAELKEQVRETGAFIQSTTKTIFHTQKEIRKHKPVYSPSPSPSPSPSLFLFLFLTISSWEIEGNYTRGILV